MKKRKYIIKEELSSCGRSIWFAYRKGIIGRIKGALICSSVSADDCELRLRTFLVRPKHQIFVNELTI